MKEIKFKKIFNGLQSAYGQYVAKVTPLLGEKAKGKAFIKKNPVTDDLWKDHLEGKDPALGIIPINADSQCRWGCIDIDQYNFDHKKFITKVREKNLPLVICRSKSGGAHAFLFTKDYIEAELMQGKLKELAAALGYSDCEIFPKQTKILVDRGDTGNFLNLPYHHGDKTTRYAFKDDGTAATLDEFFQLYEFYAVDPDKIPAIKAPVEVSTIKNGPPCLEILCSEGFPEGSRNNGLYNIGVYLKKAHPDTWKDLLDEYNTKYMLPPVKSQEVLGVLNSLKKKDYNYTCKDQPICSHCDSTTCQMREFGIGDGESMPELNSLRKLTCSPPIWFLNVNGSPVELDTEELQKQDKFQKACMDQINLIVPAVSKIIWTKLLKKLYKNLEEIEAPESLSIKEQLRGYLEDFSTNRAKGKVKEDLNRGVPWTSEGETYFRYKDFWKYLERSKWKALEHNKTAHRLREYFGVEERRLRIHNVNVRVMVVKSFEKIKEKEELPELKKGSF
jgi:hypothetical protein|tara:strand:- start:1576 stop:3084 length:1509 start_codon:yes stop_codon:yes gene_type:complete